MMSISGPGSKCEGTLESARRLLGLGFSVIPLDHPDDPIANDANQRGKVPAIKWAPFQQARATDDNLVAWFGNGRKRNIGIVTGAISNIVFVDTDTADADAWAEVNLPPTPIQTLTAKGKHRGYLHPGTPVPTKARIRDGIDVRGDGGYVVAPGSQHASGHIYRAPAPWPDLLDGVPVFDLAWLQPKTPAPAAGVTRPVPRARARADRQGRDALLSRARAYLKKTPPAIQGQGGDAHTFQVACRLVRGLDLSDADALELLHDWNQRCVPPWTDAELSAKIESARKYGNEPIGARRDDSTHTRPTAAKVLVATAAEVVVRRAESKQVRSALERPQAQASGAGDSDGAIPLGEHDPETGRLVLSPRRTLPTAEAYIRAFHQHADGRLLQGYSGLLLEWRGNRYGEIEDEAVKCRLLGWLHQALRYIVVDRRTGALVLTDFESNPTTVKQALDSIRAYVHLPATIAAPSWLDHRAHPPALEILPCRSSNVHIPTGQILPATPALFTTNALDFDYDSLATSPELWLTFLEQVFGDDPEGIGLLQEWFGYCLVADTSQQKMLLLVGPRRGGKGTIGRILARLVGIANVVGPTTGSLAGPFGLQPLIGKSLAIVSDARFTGEHVGTVVERLLCISGEDTLTIDRKFLSAVSMRLPTRFVFLTNELPRLNDVSTALAGRFLVLRLTRSFYGTEDSTLSGRLSTELPGILLWAIEGWTRLHGRRHFLQPKSGEDAIRDIEDLASPIGAFVRECCATMPDLRVSIDTLYAAWEMWCQQDGRHAVGTRQMFGRDLATAVPSVKRRRGTEYAPFYEGIGLTSDTADALDRFLTARVRVREADGD